MADKPQKTAAATKGSSKPAAPASTDSAPNTSSPSLVDLDALLEQELGENPSQEGDDQDPEIHFEGETHEEDDQDTDTSDEADADSEELDDADDPADSDSDSDEDQDEDAEDTDPAEDADGEPEEDPDDTSAAPGLEKLAKEYPWAAKRIEKQSQQIQKLKHQKTNEAVAITPTPVHPLASVEKLEDFEATIDRAKHVRRWCRENPDGGEVRVDGRIVEVTAEEVEAKLEQTESLLDQAPDWKIRLLEREREQPWKAAEAIVPDIFEEGSPANAKLKQLIKDVPELKLRIPNWEVIAACTVRGMLQAEEEKTGKVRYTRIAAGKKTAPAADKEPAPAQRNRPGTVGNKKPPAKASSSSGRPNLNEAKARYSKSQNPEDLKSVLEAELGGW